MESVAVLDEAELDPSDPGFLADPYPTLARLRERAPVLRDASRRRWFLTRHADVRACLRDRRLGRSFAHALTYEEAGVPPPDPRWQAFWRIERSSLLWLEPPAHTRIRKLVAAAFTPRSVEALREPARRLARELLARADGELELLSGFAQPYSIGLVCRLLGVPDDRQRDLLDWSHRIVKMYELEVPDAAAARADAAAADFHGYVVELIRERRARPRDDMISALLAARVDGGGLTDDEIVCTVIVLLDAGHEATVNTIGNGLLAFARRPREWRRVVAGEVPPAAAIEEMLRYDTPLQLFERWVLTDGFAVGGVEIPRGGRLSMLFGAANRDPRVFPDPDVFDPGRAEASRHVGFGGGVHACIGAPLARLELAEAVDALRERLPELRLAEEPRRTGAFVIWGLEGLRLLI